MGMRTGVYGYEDWGIWVGGTGAPLGGFAFATGTSA
jgi:hypothetical protein